MGETSLSDSTLNHAKPTHLKAILSLPNVDAVVLRTFGAGNAMEDANFLAVIEDVIRIGKKTILNVTQCLRGMVEMGLYEASLDCWNAG
jgi:L-asparaginase